MNLSLERNARSALLLGAICGALGVTGCKRSEDQAAKARIFSPEEPVGAQAEAQEKLDARKLGADAALAERVLRMPQAEIAHRLGAHKTTSRISFDWQRGAAAHLADGGVDSDQLVALTEDVALAQSANGDFSVELKNDHNRGFALVWAGGTAYARSLFGAARIGIGAASRSKCISANSAVLRIRPEKPEVATSPAPIHCRPAGGASAISAGAA